MDKASKDKLFLDLFNAECIKFGSFKLKNGSMSPVYIDLRTLVGFPILLEDVGEHLSDIVEDLLCERIAAIPYAGIPLGVATSLYCGIPMIYTRKEVKDHGINRVIEGPYKEGETAVIIDDMITDGASKIEAIEPLVAAGLKVKSVVILLDRGQGGDAKLAEAGYTLYSVGTLSEVLESIVRQGKVTAEKQAEVMEYIAANQFT